MKKNMRTGTRLFFVEFLIVLFFFLIVSTICLQLFARSDQLTRKANALSHAQASASSLAAATWQVSSARTVSDLVSCVAACFPEAAVQGDTLTMTYDRSFEDCDPSQAFYTLEAVFSEEALTGTVSSDTDAVFEEDTTTTARAASDTAASDVTDTAVTDDDASAVPSMWSVSITICDRSGALLYELTTAVHRPLTREEADV